MEQWFAENWFNFFTIVFGFGGLWFTAFSIRKEAKARRIANLLAVTANHRELWKEYFRYPTLARVVDRSADLKTQPVTPAEHIFMNMVISHTSSAYESLKGELITKQEGLRQDVKSFFSLPIPQAVWQKAKPLQNQDFAAFIESSLA